MSTPTPTTEGVTPEQTAQAPEGNVVSSPTDQVWGDYRIGRKLGEGGMGFVFEAVRQTDGAEIALKFLRPNFPLDERLVHRFRNEPKLASRLEGNPHVVQVFEAGTFPNGVNYFAMERLRGGSLKECLSLFRGAYESAARLAARVARALEFIHGCGVIHRDLKPGNLLFRSQPGHPEDVVITDFGLARSLIEMLRFTASGEFVGTAVYGAPEQLVDARSVDARADLFSVGALLFRMLTGLCPVPDCNGYPDPEYIEARRIHPPANLVQAANGAGHPEPPWDLVYVCRRCLEPEPENRFQTARELAQALEHYLLSCS